MRAPTLLVERIGRRSRARVLGETWSIVWERRDDDRAECDEPARTIRLDPERARCEDLLHEIIHAIEFALQLDSKKDDELWVQGVARGLWAVCQDNAWFPSVYLAAEA